MPLLKETMNTIQLSQKFSAIEQQIAEIRAALIEANILKPPAPAAKPAELPSVDAHVTTRFRAGVSFPFTVVGSFECPSCDEKHEAVQFQIGTNGGSVVTSCGKCGQNIRVKLAWSVDLK